MDFPITLTLKCSRPDCGVLNQVEIEDEEDFGTKVYCASCGLKEVQIPEQSELEPLHEAPEPAPPVNADWILQKPERLKWQFPIEDAKTETPRHPLLNCPAVDADGRLFACLQNEVVALAIANDEPEVLWKFPAGRLIPGSPSLGPDGKLRVHSLDGMLYCLTKDGELVFDSVRVGDPLGSATPLGDLEGNTWVCAATGDS